MAFASVRSSNPPAAVQPWSRRRPSAAWSATPYSPSAVVRRAGLRDRLRLRGGPAALSARPRSRHDLAAQQVERLDAVGAFVDRVQPVVAIELLDGGSRRMP